MTIARTSTAAHGLSRRWVWAVLAMATIAAGVLVRHPVGGAPGQPLRETNNYPGMAVPQDGFVVVSDAPGFGHGHSLDSIAAMTL